MTGIIDKDDSGRMKKDLNSKSNKWATAGRPYEGNFNDSFSLCFLPYRGVAGGGERLPSGKHRLMVWTFYAFITPLLVGEVRPLWAGVR
jgi:hypothetical protein